MKPDTRASIQNAARSALMSNDTRSRHMTTETDLLPMPKGEAVGMYQAWSYDQMQAYARANVAHATATLQTEIEALLEERDALQAENERLREALKDADSEMDWLDEDMDTCDHSVGVCMCSYWSVRRKMKSALAREDKHD